MAAALTLATSNDFIMLKLSSGLTTQFLWLYAKFSEDGLWWVQLGPLLMSYLDSRDLIVWGHVEGMAVLP